MKTAPWNVDGVVELGAQWIHGYKSNGFLWPNASRLSLKGSETDYLSAKLVDYDGRRKRAEQLSQRDLDFWSDHVEEAFHRCTAESEHLWKKAELRGGSEMKLDYSLHKCLKSKGAFNSRLSGRPKPPRHYSGALLHRLLTYFEWQEADFEYTVPATELSLMHSLPTNGDMEDADFLITDPRGYATILEESAAPFKSRLLLNHVVREVHWSSSSMGGKVTVVSDKHGQFTAKRVICTLPLGVMQRALREDPRSLMRFSPPLPAATRTGFLRMGFGNYSKIYARWEQNFWGTDKEVFILMHKPLGKLPWAINLDHPKYMLGSKTVSFHVCGEWARKYETLSLDEMAVDIQQVFKLMLGRSSVPKPVELLRTDWSQNPHFFGSYSFAPLGMTERHFEAMASPVEDQLFFAGEHTAEFYGFVHGAVESGERAGRQVASAIKKASQAKVAKRALLV